MDATGTLLPAKDPGGVTEGKSQKVAPLSTGSAMRRKRFSDITNITSGGGGNGRAERSDSGDQENPSAGLGKCAAKDYIALLKENNLLLRLVDEKNKTIEMNATQLQRLQEKNWEFAQANSRMLAELNLGKDRLKAMQHKLGCMAAILSAKTQELQEEKKLNKQLKTLSRKIVSEESHLMKSAEVVGDDASHQEYCQKPLTTNRKRTLRSRSLGPANASLQGTAKEKDEGRRKSLRHASNMKTEQCEPMENLFEIEDLKLPIRSQEDCCSEPSPTAAGDTIKNVATHKKNQMPSPQFQRRQSLRPMRRAAEKVNSYREAPINVKMRREE